MTPTGFFGRNAIFLLVLGIILINSYLQIRRNGKEMEEMVSEPISMIMGGMSDLLTAIELSRVRARVAELKGNAVGMTGRELLDDPEIESELLKIRFMISQTLDKSTDKTWSDYPLTTCVDDLRGMETYAIMALDFLDDGPQILLVKGGDVVWQSLPESEVTPEFLAHLDDIVEWTDMWMACKTRRFSTPPWTSP